MEIEGQSKGGDIRHGHVWTMLRREALLMSFP